MNSIKRRLEWHTKTSFKTTKLLIRSPMKLLLTLAAALLCVALSSAGPVWPTEQNHKNCTRCLLTLCPATVACVSLCRQNSSGCVPCVFRLCPESIEICYDACRSCIENEMPSDEPTHSRHQRPLGPPLRDNDARLFPLNLPGEPRDACSDCLAKKTSQSDICGMCESVCSKTTGNQALCKRCVEDFCERCFHPCNPQDSESANDWMALYEELDQDLSGVLPGDSHSRDACADCIAKSPDSKCRYCSAACAISPDLCLRCGQGFCPACRHECSITRSGGNAQPGKELDQELDDHQRSLESGRPVDSRLHRNPCIACVLSSQDMQCRNICGLWCEERLHFKHWCTACVSELCTECSQACGIDSTGRTQSHKENIHRRRLFASTGHSSTPSPSLGAPGERSEGLGGYRRRGESEPSYPSARPGHSSTLSPSQGEPEGLGGYRRHVYGGEREPSYPSLDEPERSDRQRDREPLHPASVGEQNLEILNSIECKSVT